MKLMRKTVRKWPVGLVALAALAVTLRAEPLKLGYSDWPGWTVLEVANQKGWFKEAGVSIELVWFDYSASLDAFSTGNEAPGLIYNVIAVNPTSYAQYKDGWTKVVKVLYRCVDYLQNPATHDDDG